MMNYIYPLLKIEYIIIGTGKSKFEVPENVYERFVKQGIKVDILPTVYFNLEIIETLIFL